MNINTNNLPTHSNTLTNYNIYNIDSINQYISSKYNDDKFRNILLLMYIKYNTFINKLIKNNIDKNNSDKNNIDKNNIFFDSYAFKLYNLRKKYNNTDFFNWLVNFENFMVNNLINIIPTSNFTNLQNLFNIYINFGNQLYNNKINITSNNNKTIFSIIDKNNFLFFIKKNNDKYIFIYELYKSIEKLVLPNINYDLKLVNDECNNCISNNKTIINDCYTILINNLYYFKKIIGDKQRLGYLNYRIHNFFENILIFNIINNDNIFTISSNNGYNILLARNQNNFIEIGLIDTQIYQNNKVINPIINISQNNNKIIIDCLGSIQNIITIEKQNNTWIIDNNYILENNILRKKKELTTRIQYNKNTFTTNMIQPREFIIASIIAILIQMNWIIL